MSKYIHPGEKIEAELYAAIRNDFKQYFDEENIHPQKVNIDFSQKGGQWSAGVSINFQSKPDFVTRTHPAVYRYLDNRKSRSKYWYCEQGLIND